MLATNAPTKDKPLSGRTVGKSVKRQASKGPKGYGRPSDYSEEISTAICDQLTEGKSLRSICSQDGYPHIVTVLRWLEAHPSFADRYARARELQADVMDAMILDVVANCTPETAQADRVKILGLQWRAAKLLPKRYGDKVTQEHTGDITLKVVTGVPRQQISASVGDVIEGEIVGQDGGRLDSQPSKPEQDQ